MFWAGFRCRLSPQWSRIRRLGRWLEDDVFPLAGETGEEVMELTPRPDGSIMAETEPGDVSVTMGNCRELCDLLERAGIRRIRADIRLESNQIEDALLLIAAYKNDLASRGEGASRLRGVIGEMNREEGFHYNCMQIMLRDEALIIKYSYCLTRISMAVRWFERKHPRFGDHRALFHSAPRYGMLAAALALATLLGFLLTKSLTFLIVATSLQAIILFTAVYVFMRGMGSIEYDNEENAYRLSRANAELTRYTKRIRHELEQARTVQRILLPDLKHMPLAGNIEWAGHFTPAEEIGGDYFDAAPLNDRAAALVFADVSGHGMAAALITVIVKMAFQSWVEENKDWSPGAFARRVNRDLCRYTPEGSFVVLIAAIYDDSRKCLTFVNAGHSPAPFFIPADTAQPPRALTQSGAMLLGVQPQIETIETEQRLGQGDVVFFATDGLTEARDSRENLYGNSRVFAILGKNRSNSLDRLIASLLEDVNSFAAGFQQTDDISLLALRMKEDS